MFFIALYYYSPGFVVMNPLLLTPFGLTAYEDEALGSLRRYWIDL